MVLVRDDPEDLIHRLAAVILVDHDHSAFPHLTTRGVAATYLQNANLVSPILHIFAVALAWVPGIARAQTDDSSAKPITGTLLLDRAPITLTASFSRPATPTTLELATRFIGDQIDKKRNAEASEAMIDRIWKASFLGFIPIKPGGHPANMNSPVEKDDDPFFTPAYLSVIVRQLDREVVASDKRARSLFGP